MTKEFIAGLLMGFALGLIVNITVTLATAPNYKVIQSKSVSMTGKSTTIETDTTEVDYRKKK